MMFDYCRHRFFVIPLLVLLISSVGKCQDDFSELDERIQRLEDFVGKEVLTYLRLLRLQNEQQLRILNENTPHYAQQYYSQDYGDLDWLQTSYNSGSNPEQFTLWGGTDGVNPTNLANSQVFGPPTDTRRSKIPSINAGREYSNGLSPFPFGINGGYSIPGSIQTQPYETNINRNLYDVNNLPTVYNDQQRNSVLPLISDDYNANLRQVPILGRERSGIIQGGVPSDDGYRFTSRGLEPFSGLTLNPLLMRGNPAVGKNNFATSSKGAFNGLSGKPIINSSKPLNNVQSQIDIDKSTDFISKNMNNRYKNNLQPTNVNFLKATDGTIPKMKEQGNALRDTNSIVGGGIKPSNKKYKVVIVDGESEFSDEVNFDQMHKKLFSSQGVDSSVGTVKTSTKLAEEPNKLAIQPQRAFQTVSMSNNGDTLMSGNPQMKSTNVISFQGGAEGTGTKVTAVSENQPRDLGSQYNVKAGYGNLGRMNILPNSGYKNMRQN